MWVSELYSVKQYMVSSYVCQPNHSYVDFMFHLRSDLTRAIVVAGVLHSVWSELPIKRVLFISLTYLWPHSFHKITAFVWYLLHAMTPPTHNISAILTYRSY